MLRIRLILGIALVAAVAACEKAPPNRHAADDNSASAAPATTGTSDAWPARRAPSLSPASPTRPAGAGAVASGTSTNLRRVSSAVHVTRLKAGPLHMTVKAEDFPTIDAYLSSVASQ